MSNWLWSIFGNDDNWPPPEWFTRKRYWMALIFGRKLGWLIRNPLHNATRYRWGWKGKSYTVIALSGDTWGEAGKLNRVILNLWDGNRIVARHKFYSYRNKYIEWYIGWRPSDGAFGIALRRAKSK